MDWDIARGDKKCQVCEKAFVELEEYFSALYDEKPSFIRRDYCVGCWDKRPAEEAFSFWKTRLPKKDEQEKKFVDDEIIMNFFLRLENETDRTKRNFRYVLGLLLMRKRVLKFKDVKKGEGGETLVLYDPKEDKESEVYNPQLTGEEIEQVTQEIGQILNVKI